MTVPPHPIPLDDGLWLWTGMADDAQRRKILRQHLAGLAGCAPEQLRLERDPLGRPYIVAPAPDLHFSQARRGDVLVVAARRGGLVGVDVESLRHEEGRDLSWVDAVAGDFFAAGEARWLRSLPDAERADGFFRLWTAKEAVLKALGRGIAQGMRQPELSSLLTPGQPLNATPCRLEAHECVFKVCWWDWRQGQVRLCRALLDEE